jgi:hypothetical protein
MKIASYHPSCGSDVYLFCVQLFCVQNILLVYSLNQRKLLLAAGDFPAKFSALNNCLLFPFPWPVVNLGDSLTASPFWNIQPPAYELLLAGQRRYTAGPLPWETVY